MSAVEQASAERSLQCLPTGWTWARLGDICDAINGRAFKSSEWRKSGLPIVRIQNLKDSNAEFNYFAGELDDRHRVRHGDLLFAWSGTPGTSFGAHIWKGPAAALNQHIFNIKFEPDALDPRYFCLALNQNVSRYVAQAQGGVGLAHITKSKFLDSFIPLAPKRKQLELVAEIEKQFSRLDEAVANLKRVKVNATRLVGSVLVDATAGRLVQPSSAAWRTVQVCEAGEVLLGRQRAPQYLTGRWSRKYLRVANIKDDVIDCTDVETMDFDEGHFAKYRLAPGDILLSEGQSPELLGQSAIFRGYDEPLCFQKTLHRFRADPEITTPEFAQIVFRSHVRSGVFRRLGSITTNIGHLTLEKFKAAPFPLPPIEEQHRIVAEVDRRLSIVREVEAEVNANLKRAQALRQAVLARAFSVGSEHA